MPHVPFPVSTSEEILRYPFSPHFGPHEFLTIIWSPPWSLYPTVITPWSKQSLQNLLIIPDL